MFRALAEGRPLPEVDAAWLRLHLGRLSEAVAVMACVDPDGHVVDLPLAEEVAHAAAESYGRLPQRLDPAIRARIVASFAHWCTRNIPGGRGRAWPTT